MWYEFPTIRETKKEQNTRIATQTVASQPLMKVKSEEVIDKIKEAEEKEPRS